MGVVETWIHPASLHCTCTPPGTATISDQTRGRGSHKASYHSLICTLDSDCVSTGRNIYITDLSPVCRVVHIDRLSIQVESVDHIVTADGQCGPIFSRT